MFVLNLVSILIVSSSPSCKSLQIPEGAWDFWQELPQNVRFQMKLVLTGVPRSTMEICSLFQPICHKCIFIFSLLKGRGLVVVILATETT